MPSSISCWPAPTPETAFDPNGLLDDLKKALAERVLNAEMDHHLAGEEPGNRRNGYGKKTVITDTGQIELAVPRDRQASFDPQLIAKYQRRFPGFDDKIISMYARGMSTREIVGHLRDLYGIDVSPDLISAVTDAVLEEVAAWQARPLEAVYPLIFFDALRVKIRDEGLVRNKAVHIALGVRADGTKEILGLWLEQNEGAKFWLRVMNELKNRGVEDVLIAVVDGLKGFPEAITAVFPQATVQTCIVHLLRHSLDFVSWKDRKPVAAALKDIYRAVDAAAGRGRARRLRGKLLGPEIPGHRPELAARLGRGHPVLCLPRRRAADFVHDECHRGAQFQAAPGGQGQRPFPQRRGGNKAPLPGLEPLREGVDHAAARVGHGQVPVRRPVRRALHISHGLIGSTAQPRTKFLTVPRAAGGLHRAIAPGIGRRPTRPAPAGLSRRGPHPPRHHLGYGWGIRGERFYVASSLPGLAAKTSFYGLYLYNEGQVRLWPYPRANGEHTADVLRRLRAEFPDGKLVLIWNCAPYHRATAVRAAAADLGIELAPLPGYSPDLMPVEALWRWLREDVTYHHCHPTAEDPGLRRAGSDPACRRVRGAHQPAPVNDRRPPLGQAPSRPKRRKTTILKIDGV